MFIKLNDLVDRSNHVVIPVVARPGVGGGRQHAAWPTLSGWDNNTWDLRDWYQERLMPTALPRGPDALTPPT